MAKKEAVLVIIKPDGVHKGIEGHILNKFAQAKLEIIATKVIKPARAMVEEHYKHIKGQPFFNDVVKYLLGEYHRKTGVMMMVYYGAGAVRKCRDIAGATNPEEADPSSIRASFGRITTRGVYENVVHVSSDNKEAEREIKLWFRPEDLTMKLFSEKTTQSQKQRVWK